MQNPRIGMRRIAAAIALINATTVVHAVSVAPVVSGNGMVVVAQYPASKVGVEVLKRGGNAVDAAVAVGHALAVAYPVAGNLGGGGFATTQLADGRKIFLDFCEVTPKAATANMHLDKGGNIIEGASTKGHLAVGVPGTVSGMEYAHEKYGIMQRAALVAPVITLADKGLILDQGDVDMLHISIKDFQGDAASGAIFLNKGQSPQVGGKLVRHGLAKTLRETSKYGIDGFYKGWVGQAAATSSKAGGGLTTQDDLVSYKTRELAPAECDYRGYHMVSAPLPSSGGVIICKMLNILEGYPLKDLGWHSAQATCHQVEAVRHAYVDRNSYPGDPDFVKNPLDCLLSKDYAAKTRAVIDPKKAGVSKDTKPGIEPHEGSNTTHRLVADEYGNAVSAMYTLNDWLGAKVTAAKTGAILNDKMDDFTVKVGVSSLYGLVQGEANSIAPDKRPLSPMSPTIVTKNGKSVMAAGIPGGSRIITAAMLIVINVTDYGMNAQGAADVSRFHQQWLSDVTNVEAYALFEGTREILMSMGHNPGVPQLANHLVTIIVGAPSLGGKPTGNSRFYDANGLRRNTGPAVGY